MNTKGDATVASPFLMKRGNMKNPPTHWNFKATLLGLAGVGVIFAYVMRWSALWMVSVYGAVAAARVISQSIIAVKVRERARHDRVTTPCKVSIVVAVWNEPAEILDRALHSLSRQHWDDYEVIVVDDGSDDPSIVRGLCDRYGFRWFYQKNAGKRHAMYRAFNMLHPKSRFVLTADSDTIWDRWVIHDMVAGLQTQHAAAGAGFVGVRTPETNWLTRVTGCRYWVASQVERASQGQYGTIMCISGPLGIYRRKIIDEIKDDFVNQTFLGRECTFGDDRHLTNLVLRRGHKVVYTRAKAWTEVPETFPKYIRQQVRWGKSHWREMFWTVAALPKHSIYLAYEWLLALLMPFLLLTSVTYCLVQLIATGEVGYLAHLGIAILVMGTVRAVAAFASTRDPWYFLLIPYGVLHLFVLLPLKFWSLATISRGHWGTRSAAPVGGVSIPEQATAPADTLVRS